jgi:hypothetical protein
MPTMSELLADPDLAADVRCGKDCESIQSKFNVGKKVAKNAISQRKNIDILAGWRLELLRYASNM